MNRVGSALSTLDAPDRAALAAAHGASGALAGARADLAVVAIAGPFADDAALVAGVVAEALPAARVVGVLAPSGIIGAGRELERGPGVAVLAASLPAARIETFALAWGADGLEGWPDGDAEEDEVALLLADPYTFPVDAALAQVAARSPGLPVVGGLAGAGAGLGRLVVGRSVRPAGAVGARIAGAGIRALVSQGCRPIGPELVVTDARGPAILALAGMPAIEKLEDVLANLPASERLLAASGLTAGVVIDENRPEHGVGDYLVRGIAGGDRATGALVIGGAPRVGQSFRFHVRDAASADAELRTLAAAAAPGLPGGAAGALLFACTGRGAGLFGVADHDAGVLREVLGVEAAGLFCQGELGPVGGANHAHGFTATALLVPRGA